MKIISVLSCFAGACGVAICLSGGANAQPARQGQGGNTGGAVLSLPKDVKRVISIDAHNYLMIEVNNNGKSEYRIMPIRHVYSGGIARLFGGTVVDTAQFVSPGAAGNGNGNLNGQGNRRNTGQGNFGVQGTGFGNNTQGGTAGGGLLGGFGGGLGAISRTGNFQIQPQASPVDGSEVVENTSTEPPVADTLPDKD